MSEQSLTLRIAAVPAPTAPEKPKKDKKHKRKKTKDYQPFFGDEGDPDDENRPPPLLPPAEQTQKSTKIGNSRQSAYSDSDKRLLAQLMAEKNKKGILNSAQQDAGTREKKDKAWGSVVKSFNAQSGRATPSNREQLTKLAAKMRSEVRVLSDKNHAAVLKKFRLSCGQTGGGPGLLPPRDFDPDEDLGSEDSATGSAGDRSIDRDSFAESASDDDYPEGHCVMESITNNRAPLLTRYDDITTPKPRKKPRRSKTFELPEDEVKTVVANGALKVSNTINKKEGEGESENINASTEPAPGTSRKGRNRATESKPADSATGKRHPPPMMKPEPSNLSFKREADATISYLDTRQKNDERKDKLECKAFESAIAANEAKKEAYEAMTAWYRAQLSNYPVPPPVDYSPYQDLE